MNYDLLKIEARLKELGLVLPEPVQIPSGIAVTFSWTRVYGDRAYVSGHGPLNPDGTVAAPLGRVGAEVSAEQAHTAARLETLAILASLKRSLRSLDRITAWLMVSGMINGPPVSPPQPTGSTTALICFSKSSPVVIAAEVAVRRK